MEAFETKLTDLNNKIEYVPWMTLEEDIEWRTKMAGYEGEEKKAIETVKKMLAKKMDISLISEITEMTEEEIKKIQIKLENKKEIQE